jgi:predicted DCC family thiol-disulfide oxidoreductase YuxK
MMDGHAVILFDGVCNLCNASVIFVIDKDKHDYFRFASLQSEFGRKILHDYNLPSDNYDSFILLENGKIYQKSTAALRVSRKLQGLWKLMYVFIVIPPFIRDTVYGFVAARRYQWFGKKDECMIPTPGLKNKFVEKVS